MRLYERYREIRSEPDRRQYCFVAKAKTIRAFRTGANEEGPLLDANSLLQHSRSTTVQSDALARHPPSKICISSWDHPLSINAASLRIASPPLPPENLWAEAPLRQIAQDL